MDIKRFQTLSKKEKGNVIFFRGKFLCNQDFESFSVAMYFCDDFFIEVIYSLDTLQVFKINCSSNPINIDLHLKDELKELLP